MKLLILLLAAFGAVAVVFFVALVLVAGGGGAKIDCDKVKDPAPGAWQAADFTTRQRLVTQFGQCRSLEGKTREQVLELLGGPSRDIGTELRYTLPSGSAGPQNTLVIFVGADGKVESTRYDSVATQ